MPFSQKTVLFTIVLALVTTLSKYFFGADIALAGFSPVLAIALFSGFIFKRSEWVFFFSIISLLVSDISIQVLYLNDLFDYQGIYADQWKNYLLLLGCTYVGFIFKATSFRNIGLAAFAAPTVYFFLSNGMVWLQATEVVYTKDAAGFITCLTAGLPFYKNSLLATLIFLPAILSFYNYLSSRKLELRLI
ncbi:MAG: hypothetical protein FJY19_02400 [Bacteroidetes bacterium]|nr:hypothetical protein [Bacteroidota bacterium]